MPAFERWCVDVGDDPPDFRLSSLERARVELDWLVGDERPSLAELVWDVERERRDA